MEEAIRNFPKQLAWVPKIVHAETWKPLGKYIVCGMGGSHLGGDIFQNVAPGFDLTIHQDYGLPGWRDDVLKRTLIIVSSYSGNTEEALSSFEEAIQNDYPVAAISTGGELLTRANERGIPYIAIPDTGIQPRSAIGFALKALAKMVGRDAMLEEAQKVGEQLAEEAGTFEREGKALAEKMRGKVPVIYASHKNYPVAYNWKIKFNETAKIPAFYNTFPELNHNEINGFSAGDGPALGGEGAAAVTPADIFHFIFLTDTTDHARIQKRMTVLEGQLVSRGFPVEIVSLGTGAMLHKVFRSMLTADWTALSLARFYGSDPEHVPMIEEFKKLIG